MNVRIIGLLVLSATIACKGDPGSQPYQPKLENSKRGDHHDFPLGVLSATGRLIDGAVSYTHLTLPTILRV